MVLTYAEFLEKLQGVQEAIVTNGPHRLMMKIGEEVYYSPILTKEASFIDSTIFMGYVTAIMHARGVKWNG